MIDVVIVGGKEKTARAVALAALNPSGALQIVSINGSGSLGGSTGARSVSTTAEEAIVLGGKTKIVDVGIGVGKKPDGTLGVVKSDGNGNLITT